MANLIDIVKKGSTNRSVTIRIIDSTDGTPETGVVWNTAGIDLWYRREGAAKVSITEATLSALTDAHSDGGFLHIGDGEYRIDLPDAAFATSANHVDVGGAVTGMVVIGGRVRLVDYDPEDTVRMGLTALPNAAADGAGGLPISDAGALDLDAKIGALTFTTANKIDARVDNWAGTAVTVSGTTALPEVDAKSISDDATAANNLELMYDGTGYAGGTTKLGVDAVAISGDTTAADNLELDYDGTGYNKSASTIGTANTIGSTGIAAIWSYAKASAAALATTTIGRYIYDKLALITSGTSINITSTIADGGIFTILQGETRTLADGNHIKIEVDGTVTDLTGFTPKFAFTKLTSNTGTSSLELSGTVVDAGLSSQYIYFEMTEAQTEALALDTGATHPYRISTNYAYRWDSSSTDGASNCPGHGTGYVSVKALATTC